MVASRPVPTAAHNLDDASLLRRRRDAIDAIAEELEAADPAITDAMIDELLRRALHSEDLEALGSIKGGDDRLVAQSIEQFRAFSPSVASNASSAAGMVRILLLQNLDLLWWDEDPDFADEQDLKSDAELLDLVTERKAGRVDSASASLREVGAAGCATPSSSAWRRGASPGVRGCASPRSGLRCSPSSTRSPTGCPRLARPGRRRSGSPR